MHFGLIVDLCTQSFHFNGNDSDHLSRVFFCSSFVVNWLLDGFDAKNVHGCLGFARW